MPSSASGSTTRTRSSATSSTRGMGTPSRADVAAPRRRRWRSILAGSPSRWGWPPPTSSGTSLRTRARSWPGRAHPLVFAHRGFGDHAPDNSLLCRRARARGGHGRRGRGRPAHPGRRARHLPRPERRSADLGHRPGAGQDAGRDARARPGAEVRPRPARRLRADLRGLPPRGEGARHPHGRAEGARPRAERDRGARGGDHPETRRPRGRRAQLVQPARPLSPQAARSRESAPRSSSWTRTGTRS